MSILEGVGLQFDESMSGWLGVGESDPRRGAARGEQAGTSIRFDVRIAIDDLSRFLNVSDHRAQLSGTVTCSSLGGPYPIRDGRFNLFSLDPASGMREMVYAFGFTDAAGTAYFLRGHKEIHDDPGKVDVVEDMTRLFTVIYRGEDDQSPVYGASELRFKLSDGPSLIASMKVVGQVSVWQKAAAYSAFASFAYGALRTEYLQDIRLVYDTQYENLVLSGVVDGQGRRRPFFLVSGAHERGFPWGDGETFWDVLLVIGDAESGYERYCVTDRVLEGLRLDVEHGTYRYRGPLFAIGNGHSMSFSQMHDGTASHPTHHAELDITFDAHPYGSVSFPFPVMSKLLGKLSAPLTATLRQILSSAQPLGMHIAPHTVAVRSGRLAITRSGGEGLPEDEVDQYEVDAAQTFGEAERSVFRNVKEPTLLYGYICAVRPERRAARVQIHTRTLRNERQRWAKDRLDAWLGAVIQRASSAEMLMEGGELTVTTLGRRGDDQSADSLFVKVGDPVVEVNNDHFPTAVFQRRIVVVRDPSGAECLALEEDMTRMRLEAIGSDRKATVASIAGKDKLAALDRVLDETGFDALVKERLAATGKATADCSVVIKPNFMFAYNRDDVSTFTDPELVADLAGRLRRLGVERVSVVEAQSTYGEYFEGRGVCDVAEYLGYDGSGGYEIIDMTEDVVERRHLGPHLGDHPISRAWRDADFRISFAKNKTHAYAYYTLTLKNIYGALPLADKFKEYHCDRGIYHTTIEYLSAFPVHFGLVDAYLSADGPFGIFADPRPNRTHTIIGGDDLVAVDWVAATKMGIDPMISEYMKLAVEEFGKPEIRLVGDGNPYRPWLNVPVALTLFTHKGLDADYHFGNLLYSACAQMDETRFPHKSRALHIRALRRLTVPLRQTFFVRTGENPSLANRAASWLFYRLGY